MRDSLLIYFAANWAKPLSKDAQSEVNVLLHGPRRLHALSARNSEHHAFINMICLGGLMDELIINYAFCGTEPRNEITPTQVMESLWPTLVREFRAEGFPRRASCFRGLSCVDDKDGEWRRTHAGKAAGALTHFRISALPLLEATQAEGNEERRKRLR